MKKASDKPLLEYAKDYIRDGFVVMPVINTQKGDKTEKKPVLSEWQKLTLKDSERILRAFNNPNVNAIGLLTGRVNGVYVLDVDPGADLSDKDIPATTCLKTGRGMHYYFAYPGPIGNSVDQETHLDTRGDGGFVVVPPSWHHLGEYEWLVELDRENLSEVPKWLREAVSSKPTVEKFAFGASEGGRNNSAASVIGHVLSYLHEDFWEDFAWHGFKKWNQRNTPPLPERELYKIFISIASREKIRREATPSRKPNQ